MERQGEEVHLNETEATGGVKAQGVRYVLGFSLLLVVIAMSADLDASRTIPQTILIDLFAGHAGALPCMP